MPDGRDDPLQEIGHDRNPFGTVILTAPFMRFETPVE
jgi:hypothetical protein